MSLVPTKATWKKHYHTCVENPQRPQPNDIAIDHSNTFALALAVVSHHSQSKHQHMLSPFLTTPLEHSSSQRHLCSVPRELQIPTDFPLNENLSGSTSSAWVYLTQLKIQILYWTGAQVICNIWYSLDFQQKPTRGTRGSYQLDESNVYRVFYSSHRKDQNVTRNPHTPSHWVTFIIGIIIVM